MEQYRNTVVYVATQKVLVVVFIFLIVQRGWDSSSWNNGR